MAVASPRISRLLLRPEIELLLNAVLTPPPPPDPRRDDRLRALLAAEIDWTYLIGTALAHRVTPLLCHAFRRLAGVMIPEDLMVALQTYSDDNAARNRDLAVELCAVVGDLRREGIPALPFKGLRTAAQ